jgi:hypothetical protein
MNKVHLPKKVKISEEDLATRLVEHLKKKEYKNIYAEVYDQYRRRPIDIVVKLENDTTWGIEVKVTLNLNVILQALDAKKYCNFVSICIPSIYTEKMKNYEYPAFAKILHDNGIGLFEYHEKLQQFFEKICPKENLKITKLKLLEESKNSIPGTKSGKRFTPFAVTVIHITDHVKKNPGCKLSEIISNIKHHYSTNNAAISSIRQYIKKNIIKELEINNGKVYLRPEFNNV